MKKKKWLVMVMLVLVCSLMFGTTVCAAGTGDVAGAIEGTWKDASAQIKTVVNKVVFPAIDLILAVFFFAKLGTAYFDYRKHGQFEWAAPAILFACLVFPLPISGQFLECRKGKTAQKRGLSIDIYQEDGYNYSERRNAEWK